MKKKSDNVSHARDVGVLGLLHSLVGDYRWGRDPHKNIGKVVVVRNQLRDIQLFDLTEQGGEP